MAVRIHEVTVRNFRAIREHTLDLRGKDGLPRGLTVLVGPNMAGKTTILDAIHLAYACIENKKAPKLRPGLDPDDLTLRPDPSRPIEVELVFSLGSEERTAIAELHQKLGDAELLPDAAEYRVLFQRPGPSGEPFGFEGRPKFSNQALRGRALAMIAKQRRLVKEAEFDRVGGIQYLDQHRSVVVRAPFRATAGEDELIARAAEDDLMPWLEFVSRLDTKWDEATQGESSWRRVKRLFALLAAPAALEEVVPSDEGFDLRLRSEGRSYGANGMSSGEQQLLRLVCNLVARRATRSVVLIDECELHLHPSWQRNLLHFLRAGGGGDNQFLVTTHSQSFRDLLDPDELVVLGPL